MTSAEDEFYLFFFNTKNSFTLPDFTPELITPQMSVAAPQEADILTCDDK